MDQGYGFDHLDMKHSDLDLIDEDQWEIPTDASHMEKNEFQLGSSNSILTAHVFQLNVSTQLSFSQ
jgi:hypothetical protein